MLINQIEILPNAKKEHFAFLEKFYIENPDMRGQDEINFDNMFIPYERWADILKNDEGAKQLKLIEDMFPVEELSVFITHLNSNHYVDLFTKYEIYDRYAFEFRAYGVCDNATQAINYFKSLNIDSSLLYMIFLTPIFKCKEESPGGWRWHKWGSYIGVQSPQCEYIHDEEDIDLVYCFHIYKVREKESK